MKNLIGMDGSFGYLRAVQAVLPLWSVFLLIRISMLAFQKRSHEGWTSLVVDIGQSG